MTVVSKSEETDRITSIWRTYQYEQYFNGYVSSGWDNRGAVWSGFLKKTGKVWVRTPDYLKKRKAGTLPDNSYSFEKSSYEVTPRMEERRGSKTSGGSWDIKSYHYISEYSHVVPQGLSASEFLPTDYVTLQAKLNAIQKAKGNQFNLPVFAVEAKKTSSMVVTRATQMARAMYALKRGRFKEFRNELHKSFYQSERKWLRDQSRFERAFGRNAQRAAASTWLEFQYGWIPFMLEVRSAVNTLMDVVEDPRNRVITVTGRARTQRASLFKDIIFEVSPQYWGDMTMDVSASAKCVWKCKPTSADLPGKFLITNPAEVLWEVVPLSFVVDWFLPIGDYLSTLDVSMRFSHAGGSLGLRETQKCLRSLTRGPYSGMTVSGSCKGEWVRVSRSPLNASPIPSFTEFLFAQNGLSGARIASAISLLRQRFR